MDIESKLADLLFGPNPLNQLKQVEHPYFQSIDEKQFRLFHTRLLKRLEDRLSQQFGACMALLEEALGLTPAQIASEFVTAPEYRQVREDLDNLDQASPCRFEIAFLSFVLRSKVSHTSTINEFSEIFLRELAMEGG